MRRFPCLAAALVTVATPLAAQPYSQSMAECAGIYEGVRGAVRDRADLDRLDAAADAFATAAIARARAEGRTDPEAWVAGHRGVMRAHWADRGAVAAFSRDFADWTDYCRSFATDRGIDPGLD